MKKILAMRIGKGLCNRLRVLLCAIAYSELTNRRLLVYWPKEQWFGAALSDLWEHPYQEIGCFSNKILVSLAGGYRDDSSLHSQLDNPIICLNTIYPFCVDDYPAPFMSYLSRLKLIEPLQNRLDSFAAQEFTDNPVVGVNIRYKRAHPRTLKASPPEWFIGRINEIHSQFPNTRFLLSTDCKEVSQLVRSSTCASICELPRSYRSEISSGIQEALCELYLLARTNYILGSYYSSFSETAGLILGRSAYENSYTIPDADAIASALAFPRETSALLERSLPAISGNTYPVNLPAATGILAASWQSIATSRASKVKR